MDNPEAQQLPSSGIVESRLGKIELTNGYPTDATVKRVFDEIDFQRGCQAYLWALPLSIYFDRSWVLADIERV